MSSNLIIGNTIFDIEQESSKFSLVKSLFSKLGYVLTIDEDNNFICYIDNHSSPQWYIEKVTSSSILLKRNGASLYFSKEKDVNNSESYYQYKLALNNLSKFDKEDLVIIENIIGDMWLYLSKVSND